MDIDDDDRKLEPIEEDIVGPTVSETKSARKRKRRECESECIRRHEGGPKGARYHFCARYTGHCNLKTDIKEATFFGDRYICSGSDDGRCFIWDQETGKLVNVLSAVDEEVVNTVRRHPHFPILALSGIDSTVKIWAPSCSEKKEYVDQHPIPFTNHQSVLNRSAMKRAEDGVDDDDDWKEMAEREEEDGAEGMSQRRMSEVIEENQGNLSNPPSQRIDLSTLLFWANLMNQ